MKNLTIMGSSKLTDKSFVQVSFVYHKVSRPSTALPVLVAFAVWLFLAISSTSNETLIHL